MLNPLRGVHAPVLLVGVGNTLKGDDGAGPALIERIGPSLGTITAIDCGQAPENYLRRICSHKSGSIVFVDAADIRETPGTVRLFDAEQISPGGIFTHGLSLSMIIEFIRQETTVPVYLLAVQPKSLRLGDELSPEVRQSLDTLAREITMDMNGGMNNA